MEEDNVDKTLPINDQYVGLEQGTLSERDVQHEEHDEQQREQHEQAELQEQQEKQENQEKRYLSLKTDKNIEMTNSEVNQTETVSNVQTGQVRESRRVRQKNRLFDDFHCLDLTKGGGRGSSKDDYDVYTTGISVKISTSNRNYNNHSSTTTTTTQNIGTGINNSSNNSINNNDKILDVPAPNQQPGDISNNSNNEPSDEHNNNSRPTSSNNFNNLSDDINNGIGGGNGASGGGGSLVGSNTTTNSIIPITTNVNGSIDETKQLSFIKNNNQKIKINRNKRRTISNKTKARKIIKSTIESRRVVVPKSEPIPKKKVIPERIADDPQIVENLLPKLDTWSPEDTSQFFILRGFYNEANKFKEHSIDGISLMLMQRTDFTTNLQLKLGPALKVYDQVCKLRSEFFRRHNPSTTTTTPTTISSSVSK